MIKKFLAVLVVIAVMGLTACGFENEYSEDEVTSRPSLNNVSDGEGGASQTEPVLSEIEGYDYGGRKFVIVTTNEEYFLSQNGQSLIEKAIIDRNGAVETKFNINIEIRVSTDDEIIKEGISAISRGEHYADLIVASGNTQSKLMDAGCLLNLNTLPYLDKTADYMDKELINSAEINGRLYLLYGTLAQTEYSAWCVFYNREIAKKVGIDPFELYKKGEWTWEAFLEYSSAASKYSANGFVSASEKTDFINALWATTGNKFFGDCANSTLDLPTVENGRNILSSIGEIANNEEYGKEHGTDALNNFISGKSSMILCRRDAVYEICESGINWRAVPMPKYDGESEHKAYIDGEALAVSVPSDIADSDFTGRILNALFAATKQTVTESVRLNELYYYWTDNEMAFSMEETKKNLHLDIGIIYAYSVKDIAVVTTDEIKNALDAGITPFQFYHSTKNQFNIYSKKHFG